MEGKVTQIQQHFHIAAWAEPAGRFLLGCAAQSAGWHEDMPFAGGVSSDDLFKVCLAGRQYDGARSLCVSSMLMVKCSKDALEKQTSSRRCHGGGMVATMQKSWGLS